MAVLLGITDYVLISLMLAISASVGLYFRFTGGRQKTTHEFLMAGKSMNIWPVAFSLMATYMSAISVLGLPSETYMYGTQYSMWIIGVPIGGIIAAYGFLPVFYEMEAATAYEYLEKRFGKVIRAIASLFFSLQMILYMAVVLYAPSLALNAVTGLSTWASVISLALVCTFYCSLGGLKAVLWTDMFQATLMYVTIISVIAKATYDVGGFQEVITRSSEGGRLIFFNMSFDFTERYTLWNSLLQGIIFSISTFATNQAQIQRMLSVGNLKKAQISLFISLPLIMVFTALCFGDGIVIFARFKDCDPLLSNSIKSPDQLMPFAILKLFGHIPGMSGLCIAGVFSASLSTVSSAVNSLTAVTMEDFIRPYCFCKRLTETWAAFLAKIIAIFYGGICLLLTYIVANFRGVLEASSVMFGMIGGPVMGIFFLGILTETANETGTIIGLLSGFIINAWFGFGSYSVKVKIPTLPQSIEGCPSVFNETNYNGSELTMTTTFRNELLATSPESLMDQNCDVFLPYKIAYPWFSVIGFVVTFFVGFICSFLINCCNENKNKHHELYSPFIRKNIFKKNSQEDKAQMQLQMEKIAVEENDHALNGQMNEFKICHL